MALRGYRTNSVSVQTLLSKNQIRRIFKELSDQGYDVSRKSGKPPSPAYIIRKRAAAVEAALLVSTYFSLYGQDPLKPFVDVDIDTLNTAYDYYLEYRKDLPGIGDNQVSQPLSIDSCYSIISGLRTRDMHADEVALIERCKRCNSIYLYAIRQSSRPDCVFCNWRGKNTSECSEEEHEH